MDKLDKLDNIFNEKNISNKSGISRNSFSKKQTPKKAEKVIRVNGDSSIEYLSVKRERGFDQLLNEDDKKYLFTREDYDKKQKDKSSNEKQEDQDQDNNLNITSHDDQIFSTRNLDLDFFSKKKTPEKKVKLPLNKTSKSKKQNQSNIKSEKNDSNLKGERNESIANNANSANITSTGVPPSSPNNFIQYTSSTINKYFVNIFIKRF